jgi:hypothetical protein
VLLASCHRSLTPNNTNVTGRNRITTELMKKEGFPVLDLYALTMPHPEWCSDGLHYKPDGKAAQCAQVAAEVLNLLPAK